MIIEDYTLNRKFSELKEGDCFVMYSEYYMKLFIKYYDDYSNKITSTYKGYAVNLSTGVAEAVKDDEKVRIVKGKLLIE